MNINSINVNKYPISQMFDPESKTVYEVPKYQREYVWGTREWSALYEDLFENSEGYFLGSIICINSTTDSLSPKFEVVDGQQRLTTISLLLAALYDILNEYKDSLDEDQQSDLLQLKRKLILKKTSQSLRVVPQVQGNNLDDYCGLMAKIGIMNQSSSFYELKSIGYAQNKPPSEHSHVNLNGSIFQVNRYFFGAKNTIFVSGIATRAIRLFSPETKLF